MTTINDHIRQLSESRLRAWEEAKGFLDRVDSRGDGMNGEERAQWDRYNANIDALDAEIRHLSDRERREAEDAIFRESHHLAFAGPSTRAHQNDAEQVRRMLRGEIDPSTRRPVSMDLPLSKVHEERQLLRDGATPAEIRSLVWDTGNIGSAVPASMARALYEVLEAEVSMFRAPTTKVRTSSGEPMAFPKLTTHAVGTQVIAQGTAIGGTDPAFDKVTLDAYKYGQLVSVSWEAIEDTAFDVSEFLGRDIGRGIGRLVATDLVTGTGTGEPRGILTAAVASAGSVITGGTLIPASYETLVDLAYGIPDAYRQRNTCGWMFKDATAAQLRKLRDGAGGTLGAVLWEPSFMNGIQGGQPDRLLGYPVYPDLNFAAQGSASRSILFADFSSYYIRQVGDVRIERSDEYHFNTDMVALRGKWRVDGDLLDAGAVVTSKQAPT